MITKPSSGGHKFNIVDAGSMWRVLNRPDITDYKEMKYPGFRAAFGADPNTGSHVIVYLDYPKEVYSREDLEDPNSPIGSSIKTKLQKCLICNTMDQLAEESPEESLVGSSRRFGEDRSRVITDGEVPESSGDRRSMPVLSPSEFVVPKYIPAITTIGQKVFCTKFGGVASSVVLSLVADLLSSWSSDPGHKAAFREISDQFVDQMGLCDDRDVDALKGDIGRLYDSYTKDGDVFKAVKHGFFKDVGQALKDQGVQVSATKTTNYQLNARPLRRSSAD
jgi:hypothetical protein